MVLKIVHFMDGIIVVHYIGIIAVHKSHLRIKVGAIDAAALGPFLK